MTALSDCPSRRLYVAYWQDGSIDLFAGTGLALIGGGWIVDQVVMAAIIPALLVPVWTSFRGKFIEPRLGYVRFNQARRSRLRRAHVALLTAGCLAFLLGVVVYFLRREPASADAWLRSVVPALPAVLVGIGGILSGLLFGIHRLVLYSVVCVSMGFAGALLGAEPGWSLLGGGSVAAISGAVLLTRFFRRFPTLPTELD